MQNLRKLLFIRLAYLTMAIICANYGSILAQEEQKAFKEGDKILSIGVGLGGESPLSNSFQRMGFYSGLYGVSEGKYPSFTPSISFDYGLKGTRDIVSIGGFASYSQRTSPSSIYASGNHNYVLGQDSIYSYLNLKGLRSHTFTVGIRLALHYSTKKWDLYGGTMLGYQKTFTESEAGSEVFYKKNNGSGIPVGTTTFTYPNYGQEQFIFSPYIGARYYVTKKVAFNIEAEQSKGRIGLSYKF
jgi:hypothetical protein